MSRFIKKKKKKIDLQTLPIFRPKGQTNLFFFFFRPNTSTRAKVTQLSNAVFCFYRNLIQILRMILSTKYEEFFVLFCFVFLVFVFKFLNLQNTLIGCTLVFANQSKNPYFVLIILPSMVSIGHFVFGYICSCVKPIRGLAWLPWQSEQNTVQVTQNKSAWAIKYGIQHLSVDVRENDVKSVLLTWCR